MDFIEGNYRNRQNNVFGYIWVPDKVVHNFLNQRKQGVKLSSFDELFKVLETYFNETEIMVNSGTGDEFDKTRGALLEKMIMWIEHGYPLAANLVYPYKQKLYKWRDNGDIR